MSMQALISEKQRCQFDIAIKEIALISILATGSTTGYVGST
jgi:hypothetical protein